MIKVDKKEFVRVKQDLDKAESQREEVILLSRKIIQLSKQTIYALHREENAIKPFEEMNKDVKKMQEMGKKNGDLSHIGAYKAAEQEYVEAAAYYYIIQEKRLPVQKELGVETEHYLLGICDLAGELTRRAINQTIKGNYEQAQEMRELLGEIYGQLLGFDFRNGEIRKKFDGIKYELNKLEDLMLQIKMKGN